MFVGATLFAVAGVMAAVTASMSAHPREPPGPVSVVEPVRAPPPGRSRPVAAPAESNTLVDIARIPGMTDVLLGGDVARATGPGKTPDEPDWGNPYDVMLHGRSPGPTRDMR